MEFPIVSLSGAFDDLSAEQAARARCLRAAQLIQDSEYPDAVDAIRYAKFILDGSTPDLDEERTVESPDISPGGFPIRFGSVSKTPDLPGEVRVQ